MTTNVRTTVVGVFEDKAQANAAVAALQDAGFTQAHIGVAVRHDTTLTDKIDDESQVSPGAIAGILTGLGLGALTGVGVLAGVIPVIGPAIAAGTLGVILSNAAAGAGLAGLVGALASLGIPEDEANYYDKEFEAGRIIVTVNAGESVLEARGILLDAGAYDMETSGASVV